VDCNAEGFFLLGKFSPILDAIRERNPGFLIKTSELITRFSAAAQRYEIVLKSLAARRNKVPTPQQAPSESSDFAKPDA